MATWKVSCYAWCADCGKKFDNYKNAQALAAQHSRRYGHKTRGEVGLVFEYRP